MIPGQQEIVRSLTGAWLLAKRDPSALSYFNLSIDGFWRSFAAMVLVLPILFLSASISLDLKLASEAQEGITTDAGGFYAGRIVLMIIGWVAFPLVMIPVSRVLDLSHRYVTYIIVFNWSSVLAEYVLAVPELLWYAGVIGPDILSGAFVAVLALAVLYRWYVAKTALETTGLIASTMVLLEITLSIAIWKYGSLIVG